MKRGRIWILISLISFAWTLTLPAIDDKNYEFANMDSIWCSAKDGDQAFRFIRLSAAEQSIVMQKREAILDVLKNSEEFNPLGKGTAFQTYKSVWGRYDQYAKPDTRSPIELNVRLRIGKYLRDRATGTVKPFFMEVPYLNVDTNCVTTLFPFTSQQTDEQGRELIEEPYATAATDNGLKIYLRDNSTEIVFITNGRPLWIPATSEQFLRSKMKTVRKWRADEIEESRGNGNPPPSEEDSVSMRVLHECEKELAALTPAERQQPAYFASPKGDDFLKSGLARPGDPDARPIVILNKENYYNRNLPRTAIQLIICTYNYMVPYRSDEPEHVHNTISLSRLNHLARHLEYEKLAALIEK